MSAFEFNSIAIGGRIDRLRNQFGYSIEDLANRAGLNKNTVNRVIKGVGKPNVNTFLKLCGALNITPNDLMDATSDQDAHFRIIRRNDAHSIEFRDQEPGVRIGLLHDELPYGSMECMLMEFSGEGSMRSHKGEELLMCTSGRIGLVIGERSVEIGPGEAILFHATEPHSYYHAAGKSQRSTALCVLTESILDRDNPVV